MPDVLRIERLTAGYGEAKVLHELSLSLQQGQSLALLGRNGMGKTTLINSIVGVTTYFAGRISLLDRDLTRLRPEQRAHAGIGWVPQERNIFRSLTVEENLTAVARAGAWTVQRIYDLFPLLRPLRNRQAGRLSGGEQQMLAIARTLMGNPIVLLLDEPSEGLAPIVVRRIADVLRRLRDAGASILIAEQNMHFCLGIASDATVIDKGQIVYRDTIGGLKANAEIRARYLAI